MQRRQALVVAATVAFLGASGLVAAAAVTGANVFGFHVPSPFKSTAADSATTSSEATEPPTTPAPVYVVSTEVYDEYVVVPTPQTEAPAPAAGVQPASGAAYATQPAASPKAAPTAASAAPAASPATGPAAAPTTPTAAPPRTAATAPAAAVTTTTTLAPTTTTRATTSATVFDPNGPLPAGFTVPANLKVAASQTPLPAGGPFTQCEFHDNKTWECQT
jgi:hypothetical protein